MTEQGLEKPIVKPVRIDLYPIDLDQATAIFMKIGDADTFYEPILLVSFDTDATAIHYFMAFSEVIHPIAERTFTVPDGWPCRKWLAEYAPESKIDNLVGIMFASSMSQKVFEDALIKESNDELSAYLQRRR